MCLNSYSCHVRYVSQTHIANVSASAFIVRAGGMIDFDTEYSNASLAIELCSIRDCDIRLPLLNQIVQYQKQTNDTSFAKEIQKWLNAAWDWLWDWDDD